MGNDNARRSDDEAVDSLEPGAVEDDMAEKRRAFRALSEELRKQTPDGPQTPSEILIREDRDSGHRDV